MNKKDKIEDILEKWDKTRKQIEELEEKLQGFKNQVTNEMNRREVDKIIAGDYKVTRRRNTRTYITKENVPEDIWKKYSSRCSYDALFLTKG